MEFVEPSLSIIFGKISSARVSRLDAMSDKLDIDGFRIVCSL